jgi:hypothetical protein
MSLCVKRIMGKRYFEFKAKGLCIRCGEPRAEGKTRCSKHHEKHLEYQRRHKEQVINAGLCRHCCVTYKVTGKSMCQSCLDAHSANNKKIYKEHRNACIQAYGGECVCCHTTVAKYLQLDHIENDGAQHRAKIFKCRKGSIYTWAYRNGFPKILQLLCANCHQAKTTCGGCSPEDHQP